MSARVVGGIAAAEVAGVTAGTIRTWQKSGLITVTYEGGKPTYDKAELRALYRAPKVRVRPLAVRKRATAQRPAAEPSPDDELGVTEAGRLIGMKPDSVAKAVREGRLACRVDKQGRRLICRADAEAYRVKVQARTSGRRQSRGFDLTDRDEL